MGALLIFLPLLLMVWWTLWEFFVDVVVLYRVALSVAVPTVNTIVGVIAVFHLLVVAYLAFATTAIVDVMIVATTLVAVVLSFLLMLLLSHVMVLLMLELFRRKSASS